MATSVVQVKDKIFTDPSKFIFSSVAVDSATWFFWLKEPDIKSFHYQSGAGKFTARKEQRPTSSNEYWYAYRKIGGKLRKVYLGLTQELIGDRLEQVALEISQPSEEFCSSRKTYASKEKENCVTAFPVDLSYPIDKELTFLAPGSEVGELRAEIETLRSQLAEAEGENNFQECRWKLTDRMNNGLGDECRELKKLNRQLQDEAKSISVTLRKVINYLETLFGTGRLTQRLRDGLKPESIFPLESIIKKLKNYYD